jgi:hypothetical protein
VEVPRVTEWVGHSAAIPIRVYAKFIASDEHTARARVK